MTKDTKDIITDDQSIKELRIIYTDKTDTIFSEDKYIIPLYQRGYAWEEKQIRQLIEDIEDIEEKPNYYIGSLIVYERNGVFEVIDGQQRLTSLFILLNWLKVHCQRESNLNINLDNLSFECRNKSTTTLKQIEFLVKDGNYKSNAENLYENSILNGIKEFNSILENKIKDSDWLKKFLNNLSKVILYRIEVPENTNLNRYFEIMNTRGEQLEQHDILKAKLMGCLNKKEEQELFAIIWDACADMTGYVQMHFQNRELKLRNLIFGNNWENIPSNDWNYLIKTYKNSINSKKDNNNNDSENKQYTEYSIKDIINNPSFKVTEDDGYIDEDTKVRFESIIDFPYFLLHVLKVFEQLKNKDVSQTKLQKLLDDKKLTDSFEKFISDDKKAYIEKETFTKEFILCLLRSRYLFDKFIIKREFTNNDFDGKWSIKTLHNTDNKPYYTHTKFGHIDDMYKIANKKNEMIQSALRVSYTSPKVMHWISDLLFKLNDMFIATDTNEAQKHFYEFAEEIAKKAVNENYLDNKNYYMGVNTPHIVLNYLDYLLWKNPLKIESNDKEEKIDYQNFKFEFRNSVEHWYPRNPSEGSIEKWNDTIKYNENDIEELNKIDMLGNLCLVQGNINSKFSNMAPEAKKKTYPKMIKQGSLKLQIMSLITTEKDGNSSSKNWKDGSVCQDHHDAMIKLLLDNCKNSDNKSNTKNRLRVI